MARAGRVVNGFVAVNNEEELAAAQAPVSRPAPNIFKLQQDDRRDDHRPRIRQLLYCNADKGAACELFKPD